MVGERKTEQVVDPKIPEKPSPKALKRALLVALRCVDRDAQKRPKMGHVIHMLEVEDLLFREVNPNYLLEPNQHHIVEKPTGLSSFNSFLNNMGPLNEHNSKMGKLHKRI